jgi:hypothetical protein
MEGHMSDDMLNATTWSETQLRRLDRLDLRGLRDEVTRARTVSRPRRRRGRLAIAVTAGLVVAGGAGVAAAIGALSSPDEVAQSLPAGAIMFAGTMPTCTATADDAVFDCTLATPPTQEVLDHYTGTIEPIVDAIHVVAGGCRAVADDGLRWTCYTGQRAVDEGLIGQDFLGEVVNGPGRG